MYIVGIDVGASTTKAVLIDRTEKIIASHISKSGADLTNASQIVYEATLRKTGLQSKEVNLIIATGFGRDNVPYTHRTITEITSHAIGSYHYFPRQITVVDIGGQDNKIIKVDEKGKVINFRMNRKCAAGTGAFIEEIAYKMDIPLSELNQTAKKASKDLQLGSYCTVFTGTEILTKIREGESRENIVRGVFCAVVKRIMEMDPLEGEVVITGGVVAHNDILLTILNSMTGKPILTPPEPQLTGAYGAALWGLHNQTCLQQAGPPAIAPPAGRVGKRRIGL